jgi:hypothetical protein
MDLALVDGEGNSLQDLASFDADPKILDLEICHPVLHFTRAL